MATSHLTWAADQGFGHASSLSSSSLPEILCASTRLLRTILENDNDAVCCPLYRTSIARVFLGRRTASRTPSHRGVWTARHHLTPTAEGRLDTAHKAGRFRPYAGAADGASASPPNSYAEAKSPKGEIGGRGLLGGSVDHEGGAPRSGISDPREPLTPPPGEYTAR